MTVIIIITVLVFAGLAWRDLQLGLTLLFALLPSYLIRFSLGPIPTTLLECLVLVSVAIWLTKHHGWRISLSSLSALRIPLLLGLATACFSAALSPDVFSALGILKAYYFEPVLVILMLVGTLKTRRDWYALFYALVASGSVVAIFGTVQFATKLGIPSPWNTEARITSVFDFPNAVGLFLAPILSVLLVAIVAYRQTLSGKTRIIFGLATILMTLAIVLAKTEAAIVAVPIALLITLLVAKTPIKQKIAAVIATTVIVLALGIFSAPVREKLLLQDLSGNARTAMWHETLQLLADQPLIGAGLAGFPAAIAPYHDATFYEIFQYPHNIFLNIWVELGLFGVLVFVLLAIQILRLVWQRRNDPFILAIFAALLTMTIHGLVDVPFFKNDLAMMTAGLLAALIALPSLKKT